MKITTIQSVLKKRSLKHLKFSRGSIIGTNFAFIIKYLNILHIQQSTTVWRSTSLTSSGVKVWALVFVSKKKKRHLQIFNAERYLRIIQLNSPLYRCILTIIQGDPQLAKVFFFFFRFQSSIWVKRKSLQNLRSWKYFFHKFRAKQMCFLLSWEVHIINYKIRDNNAFHLHFFLSKPSVLDVCYFISLYYILTR